MSAICRVVCWWVLLLSSLAGPFPFRCVAQCRTGQRRVTVADGIVMGEFAPPVPALFPEPDAPGLFSPDGSRFAAILSRGDLSNDTVRYTLFVFSTRDAFRTQKPLTSLTRTIRRLPACTGFPTIGLCSSSERIRTLRPRSSPSILITEN